MNGWIQTYSDESEKQKKNNNNNIKTRSLFRTFQLTFFSKPMKFTSKKAQRKNLIGKIYLVK